MKKSSPYFFHQGDLFLDNIFSYMEKTEPVLVIRENYLDNITYLGILIGNDRLWCNFIYAFEPFLKKLNKCIPLLMCEQCITEQNRLLMMTHTNEWSKGQIQMISLVCYIKNYHIRKT